VLNENIRKLSVRAGDMLVLHSIWTDLAQAAASKDFVVVTDYPKGEQRPQKFKMAMAIFAVTILLALSSRIPVSIALMTGVVGMLLGGVLTIDEAYASISWRTVFLMASLIPLGWAVDSTGAAAWVAGNALDRLPEGLPPWAIQAAIALLTMMFAVVIGNVGSTIVMVPLAINLALAVGGNPTAFALIVALSGSSNIMTVSNPVISMIGGPGGYKSPSLWRIGTPLVLVYLLVTLIAVNLLY
jgi:di/tricarboxylate transporter